MNEGYIKLWRKSLDSIVFQSPELWHLWSYCLMRANHSEQFVSIRTGRGLTEAKILSGQFIYGSKSAAIDLRKKWQTTHNRMKKLEKYGNIEMQSKTHYSIITICNWDVYQVDKLKIENPKEKPNENQIETNENPIETNKNGKNVENGKNIFVAPNLIEVNEYFFEKQFKSNPLVFFEHFENCDWKLSSGRGSKMKSWQLSANKWETNNINFKPAKAKETPEERRKRLYAI